MTVRNPVYRRALVLGALITTAGCRPAPLVRTTTATETRVVPVANRTRLADFSLDVPLPSDSGVCVRRPVPAGVGEMVSVYYPEQPHASAVTTVTVDTTGRIVRVSDRRGRVSFRGVPGGTPAQFDSAFAEARRSTRSSSVTLDLVIGQAILSNDGGGRPDQSVMALASSVANDPRFDRPLARAYAIVARCRGQQVPPSSGLQVQKPAVYRGGSTVSPHPAAEGATVVQFVVDSSGAVRPETLKVLRMEDSAIVEDAKRVLTQWRYLPAEIGGRKVSQLVQTAIVR